LLVGGFFCFRRHGQYALAMFGAAALALLPSLAHLPADIARVLYMPYVAATLVLICLLAAWDMTGYRSFMAEQECKDLKDIKIAALTQISHVIKNKLNYVEGFLSEWRERIGAVRDARIDDAARGEGPIGTAGDMDDPEDEFGTMLFCVRASLGALTSIDVLRSIKAGLYETAMPATQVDRWVADYAGNHGLAASKTVPVALVHFDVRIIALVLEDAWSNAFKYGDTAKARPEISARLLDGQTIEVSIANRQMPGKRLQEDTDALFGRGSKGSQATGLSDGFGLADARQAAEAAGGTVSLREHAVGDAWFTAFAVTLPALTFAVSLPESSSDCASVEGETATEPARGGGGAASRYRVDVRVHSAADDRRAAPLPRSHARAGDEAADSRDPFPRGLTVLACDDERVQRRVLEKIFLGKLGASEASVVLGANLDEVQSVIRKAVTLKADIVILDQNLLHGGVVGTQLADDLRAAGFGGFVVLRTGSTAEGLRRLQVWPSVDLAVGKEEKNMDVIAQIKRAYLGTMPATPGTSALVPAVAVAEAERAVA
jgi:signal transduction histidine kinase/CheY-like chemotaxis protein